MQNPSVNALPIYVVDAFTNHLFGGNPAAVCPLQNWLSTELMQQFAAENNLSETAFFIQRTDGDFDIRWFTPEVEIDLAGHPTLATAFIIFNYLNYNKNIIHFHCLSGKLVVEKKGDLLEMNFPARMPIACAIPENLIEGFNIKPKEVLRSRDYVLVYETQAEVEQIIADFNYLNKVETLGIIVTAKGNDVDFVSRFFVPNSVIGEDPVTGSAHATLIPYWSNQLQKNELKAIQISKRKGNLWCGFHGARVTIAGECVLYSKGEYFVAAS
jgi:PhzF family phenazine biosynthesis protein